MRYPLVLYVRYRIPGSQAYGGEGQVVNISSGGVLIVCSQELAVGAELEVCMEWPPLLDGWIHLQLVALGRVVRGGKSSFALTFSKHHLRTLKSKLQPISTPSLNKTHISRLPDIPATA